MGTKAGMGIVPKVISVAVVLGVAAFLYPKITDRKEDDNGAILLQVSFGPQHRSGQVQQGRQFPDKVVVELTAGGTVYPNTSTIDSPWTMTLPSGRGRKITLRASQVYGTSLSCLIKQPGYPGVTDSAIGPSQVACIYVTK